MDDYPLCVSLHPSRGYYDDLFTDVDVQAATAGKIDYDGAAAAKCLDGFFSTCVRGLYALPRGRPAECDRIFLPSAGDQEACGANDECISGQCALIGPCTQFCCDGICSGGDPPPPRPSVGESCAQNPNCVDSFCYSPAMICAPYFPYGVSCDSTPQCLPGLRCDNGICLSLAGTGDPCTQDDDCQYVGDFCNGLHCQHYSLGGAACNATTQCATYYHCDGTTMTCKLGARLGESCVAGSFCIDASTCDPNTMTCVPLLPDGATCFSGFQCAGGQCNFGTCQTFPACF